MVTWRSRLLSRFHNAHSTGQRTNRTIHVLLVSSATPRATPATRARYQLASFNQSQKAKADVNPRAVAPRSGVISCPFARIFGQKHQRTSDRIPAGGPYNRVAHRKHM